MYQILIFRCTSLAKGGVAGIILAVISALTAFLYYFVFQLLVPKNRRNAMGAAIITAFTAPIITSMCDKHMRKKKLGVYSDAAIAEREVRTAAE